MALISKYGTTFGTPLLHTGRIFFVSPSASYTVNGNSYDASDDNKGTSPEMALRTVARAIVLATANAGDVIHLLEGTHTVTATVNVSKAGLTFRGPASDFAEGTDYEPKAILTSTGTNDELLNITADNTEFHYLTIRPTTGYSAVSFQTTSAVAKTLFHRCYFDLNTPAVNLQTRGIDLGNRGGGAGDNHLLTGPSAVTKVRVIECIFDSDGAQGPGIRIATGGVMADRCTFISTGAWASPFVVASGGAQSLVRDSTWVAYGATGTYSACISGNTADAARALFVDLCRFPATPGADAIRGFGAQEIQAVDCYYAAATDATTVNAIARMLS